MTKAELETILNNLRENKCSIDEAANKILEEPFTDLGFAKIDNHRKLRKGASEVIYGEGKTSAQICAIAERMHSAGEKTILVTRVSKEKSEEIKSVLTDKDAVEYYGEARIILYGSMPEASGNGKIVIAAAGTSDINVAEEAAVTAEALGNSVVRLYDVGVAGIHRLLSNIEFLMDAQVIIAVAGMEGALASVIAGLAPCPVIAVPTSVGYGSSFGGIAALLSMLNSCASGVSVVNIDNGFGAAFQASMINHLKQKQ